MAALLALLLSTSSFTPCSAYTVVSGDTYWKISQKNNITLSELLSVNESNTNQVLYVGDKLLIPGVDVHITSPSDTYWKISQKYGIPLNKLLDFNRKSPSSILNVGDIVFLYQDNNDTKPYITYTSYTVKSKDTLWSVAILWGIPYAELCSVNGKNNSSYLQIGEKLTIPLHQIPVLKTPTGCGEYLDWLTQAQYVIPVNAVFTVVDFYTGKTFNAKRTTGANHADCEPLTTADTNKMKSIWGGNFSWDTRPVLIKYNDRTIAASVSSYEHAGNDNAPGGLYTTWRSGNYGPGENYDWVKGNKFDGVFDIHFKNSTSHNTGAISSAHQASIKIAAGK